MKWEMEVEEIEAVLEKIWYLHDKLSDAIHTVSRSHFLNTIKNPHRKSSSDENQFFYNNKKSSEAAETKKSGGGGGFVFVKEFRVLDDDEESAVLEAKSLYAIRTALENLEDQLEFLHTVQTQQRAEKDSAIARLEQSRIILAMRLAEHQGKKYKVIEEAQALVGDVRDVNQFVSPENLYKSTPYPSDKGHLPHKGKSQNPLFSFFFSSCNFVSKSLKLDHTVGILGNAALLAISMIAFVHLNQDPPTRKVNHAKGLSSGNRFTELDVMLARG